MRYRFSFALLALCACTAASQTSAAFATSMNGVVMRVGINSEFADANSVSFGRSFRYDSLYILPRAGMSFGSAHGQTIGLMLWHDYKYEHLRFEGERVSGIGKAANRGSYRVDALIGDANMLRFGASGEVRDSTGARRQVALGPAFAIEVPAFPGNYLRFSPEFGLYKGSRNYIRCGLSLLFP